MELILVKKDKNVSFVQEAVHNATLEVFVLPTAHPNQDARIALPEPMIAFSVKIIKYLFKRMVKQYAEIPAMQAVSSMITQL